MRARRWILKMVGSLCALSGALALSTAPAPAAVTHKFLGSFAPVGVSGLAVDESTGSVYVLGAEGLYKFDSSGAPEEFSALTGQPNPDVIEGVGGRQLAVDNSSGPDKGDIYVATGGYQGSAVTIYGSDGSLLGSLGNRNSQEVVGVATDAVGNVYMSEQGLQTGFINKYQPTVNPVADADYISSLGPVNEPNRLAADSEGNLYVVEGGSQLGGPVRRYDALQFGPFTPSGTQLSTEATSVAVDTSSDHVYVDRGSNQKLLDPEVGNQVLEMDSSGTQIGAPVVEGLFSKSSAIAVDGTRQKIYVSANDGEVDVFSGPLTVPDITTDAATDLTETSVTLNGTLNPLGIQGTCEVEFGVDTSYGSAAACSPNEFGATVNKAEPVTAALGGLVSGTVYHYRLAATNANGTNYGQDQTFATLHAPVVDGEKVRTVGALNVTVEAQINPKSAITGYHFEYGTSISYDTTVPVPNATIPAFADDRTVVWTLSGLQPGTLYHYRVVATNPSGTVDGPDQVFKTYPGTVTAADPCADAPTREVQFSSYLPDCRVYEMASPVDKGGANIAATRHETQSAGDGNAVRYSSATGFGDVQGSETPGAEYVASRAADGSGWSSHSINPVQESTGFTGFTSSRYVALSSDLSKGVFWALSPVTSGHPNVAHWSNLYLRTDIFAGPPGNYELLSDSVSPGPASYTSTQLLGVVFGGASADFSHILVETARNLTPETTTFSGSNPKLYEWNDGVLKLAGILPDGTPAESSAAAAGVGGGAEGQTSDTVTDARALQTVSADGSRFVFEAPVEEANTGLEHELAGNLYMRIDGKRTIKLNVNERSEPDPNLETVEKSAVFQAATPDESKVFFTSNQALTNDAVADGGERQLYVYDVNAPEGKHLTLISVDREPVDNHSGKDFALRVVGISRDGNYVYFLSPSQYLLPGMPELGSSSYYIYVWHNGVVRFVSGVSSAPARGNNQVSTDGLTFVVVDGTSMEAERAGVDGQTGGHTEVYVYEYETDKLKCASCNPSGSVSASDASIIMQSDQPHVVDQKPPPYIKRSLVDSGRYTFFDTKDALLPQDTNGQVDVYEYDTRTAEVHLISSGRCGCGSFFADASIDGGDVFFATREKLVRRDIDNNADLYDARIEGGIPSQNAAPTPVCEGDDCQGPAKSPPAFSLPASSTFVGSGNAAPASKLIVRGKAKVLSRAQKLAKALSACKKTSKSKRRACEVRARKHRAKKSTMQASRRIGR